MSGWLLNMVPAWVSNVLIYSGVFFAGMMYSRYGLFRLFMIFCFITFVYALIQAGYVNELVHALESFHQELKNQELKK